jgi:S1-C subfamily serine protease
VLINHIHGDSPAARGGLADGDIVVAVEGREVDDPEGMRFRLATLPIGGDARLTVLRSGTERTIAVRLVAPPETPARDKTEIAGRNPFAGATLVNLNPALAEEIGINSGLTGVMVIAIKRGSVANRLGLQPGDMLLKINERQIASVADARQSLGADQARWAITIKRNGEVMSLVLGG